MEAQFYKKRKKKTASAAARNSISMRAFCWLIIKEPSFFKVLKVGEASSQKAYLFVTSTRFQQKRWQLMTQLGKRSLAEMTSNDKPCVHMDSLVVLYNISHGQLGNLLWEGSAKDHQLTSGTSLVVRHRLSGHMPPNYGRALPGAALTGFGIPPSIITASRTQCYTSSYTTIYHTWYVSYYHTYIIPLY